jgi:hypothetical protein
VNQYFDTEMNAYLIEYVGTGYISRWLMILQVAGCRIIKKRLYMLTCEFVVYVTTQ